MIRALVVHSDGHALHTHLDGTPTQMLGQLRGLIGGGHLEAIGGEGWVGYLNDEGKLTGLGPNWPATELAADLGWRSEPPDYLAGPVIFLGRLEGSPDETDVPPRVLRAWAGVRTRLGLG